jgi:hypothetical protein
MLGIAGSSEDENRSSCEGDTLICLDQTKRLSYCFTVGAGGFGAPISL